MSVNDYRAVDADGQEIRKWATQVAIDMARFGLIRGDGERGIACEEHVMETAQRIAVWVRGPLTSE